MIFRIAGLFFGFWLNLNFCIAQIGPSNGPTVLVQDIEFKTDTAKYSEKNKVIIKGEDFIAIPAFSTSLELDLLLSPAFGVVAETIQIIETSETEVLDSLILMTPEVIKGRIKFENISNNRIRSVLFKGKNKFGKEIVQEFNIMLYVQPKAQFLTKDDELFVGEVKVFEIYGSHLEEVLADNLWKSTGDFEYRLKYADNTLRLYLVAKSQGKLEFKLDLYSRSPYPDGRGGVSSLVGNIKYNFQARTGRLAFLQIDRKEISLGEVQGEKGFEIYLENNRNLQIKKTYRLEAQPEAGGKLIAEIFTQSALSNNRVLCFFRPYLLHKQSDGYLYLKDGDEPKFITNITISPKLQIKDIALLLEGNEWTNNLTTYPGTDIQLKLEGEGLHKAKFQLEDLPNLIVDSIRGDENIQILKIKIPLGFSKKRTALLADGKPSGFGINLKEYQEPQKLDFVNLLIDGKTNSFSGLPSQIMYPKVLQDLIISFNPEKIDDKVRLFGKQYISIQVNIFNSRQQLLESRIVENIVVCPGESSPRFQYYSLKDCNKNEIALNNLLSRKTYTLEDWSSIEIIVKHNQGNYSSPGYSKKVNVVLKRKVAFDLDVSFPGGLLIRRVGDVRFDPISGVSLAVIGQFRFFKPNQIDRPQPYRVGLGFLALNAFNFGTNVNRDLGVVALGSVFPVNTGQKLSFPIHAGFGYLTNANRFFFLLGPGVQVRF